MNKSHVTKLICSLAVALIISMPAESIYAADNYIMFAGQSNAARLNDTQQIAFFESKYLQYANETVEISFAAWSGSALLDANTDSGNYWLNDDLSDGTRMVDALSHLQGLVAAAKAPTLVVWIQGEQDASRILSNQESDNYFHGLNKVFDRFESVLGEDVVFGICVTGRRLYKIDTNTGEQVHANKEQGIQLVRTAQHKVAALRDNAIVLTETYDLKHQDQVHFYTRDVYTDPNSYADTSEGQWELLNRIAKSAASDALGNGFIPVTTIKAVNLNSNDRTQLLVELSDVGKKLYHGSGADWLFSAHLGTQRVNVATDAQSNNPHAVYKISESLLLITMESAITSAFEFRVGHNRFVLNENGPGIEDDVGIEDDNQLQNRNDSPAPLNDPYRFPLGTGNFEISGARW